MFEDQLLYLSYENKRNSQKKRKPQLYNSIDNFEKNNPELASLSKLKGNIKQPRFNSSRPRFNSANKPVPGPCDYETYVEPPTLQHSQSFNVKGSTGLISKTNNRYHTSSSASMPGPTTYTYDKLKKNNIIPDFKSGRELMIMDRQFYRNQEEIYHPRPGDYDTKNLDHYYSNKTRPIRLEHFPSPVKTKPKESKYYLGIGDGKNAIDYDHTKRFKTSKTIDAVFHEKSKNIKFDKYDPTKVVKERVQPGPGDYIDSKPKAFTESKRFEAGNLDRFGSAVIKKSKSESKIPGPGAYEIESKYSEKGGFLSKSDKIGSEGFIRIKDTPHSNYYNHFDINMTKKHNYHFNVNNDWV